MNMVLVTASEATRSATSPLPTMRAFRKATARSSWTIASRGETTERPGSRSRMRAATASGSWPLAQKTAAAVAIGSRLEPGTSRRQAPARPPGGRTGAGAAHRDLPGREIAPARDEPAHLLRERAEQDEGGDADGDAPRRERAPHPTAPQFAERLTEGEHGAVRL